MNTATRLTSLDIFRGLTIVGMIIVNDPGSWSAVYAPLLHADWHGITPTDFVFPFFLFIVGVSIVFAYSKRLASGADHGPLIQKILKRSATIFALGLFLWLFPKFDFAGIRIPGVLQRIALVFLACSLLFLKTSWKTQVWVGTIILVGYWLLMATVPVPIDAVIAGALETGKVMASAGEIQVQGLTKLSDGLIAANLEPGTNLEAYIDRMVIPGRMWQVTWDPEGILSTLPSIATGICGMMVGRILILPSEAKSKVIHLFELGFIWMVIGNVWDWFFPFNKNLWTSSFVMYTAGLATLTLALLYWWVDVLGNGKNNKIFFVGKVFGANAITAYVIHGMLPSLFAIPLFAGAGFQKWMVDGLVGMGIEAKFVSLIWALFFLAICYVPIYILYKREIIIKV